MASKLAKSAKMKLGYSQKSIKPKLSGESEEQYAGHAREAIKAPMPKTRKKPALTKAFMRHNK